MKPAFWRLRRSFTRLSLTGAGILAAAVLVCTVPLYSQVATTAGLRGILLATPTNKRRSRSACSHDQHLDRLSNYYQVF